APTGGPLPVITRGRVRTPRAGSVTSSGGAPASAAPDPLTHPGSGAPGPEGFSWGLSAITNSQHGPAGGGGDAMCVVVCSRGGSAPEQSYIDVEADPTSEPTRYVGLEVSKDTNPLGVAEPDGTVSEYESMANDPGAVRRLAQTLGH